ncbi:MAG: aminoacyl--tRNA ligase-related protein [Candidatus Micrarchaeia archaeon]
MLFELEAVLEFSNDVSGKKDEIGKLLNSVNEELFKRGAPKGKESEASRLEEWSVEGNKLKVRITSGRYVRAPDALLRLRSQLNLLGAKIKAGVRRIEIKKLEVKGVELGRKPSEAVKVAFYVDRIDVKGDKADIKFSPSLPIDVIEAGGVDRIVELVVEKVERQEYEGKEEVKKLLWESKEKKMFFDKDPSAELERMNWIKRTHAKGQFIYGKNFTSIVNAIKEILLEHLYKPLGFREMIFPKFEPWDVPKKSGHAKSIYPDAYYVMVPKVSNPKEWEEVMDYFRITGEVYKEGIIKRVEPVGILSYAQCPPFWQFLEGKVIREESLPLKLYDWSGPTYRNEAGGTHGIARVEEFHRVETLFIGSPEQVRETAKKVEEKLTFILDELLELEIKKYSVVPWWMAQEGEKKLSDKATEGIGTIDFEAYLPYKGSRERSEWLEIQNVSVIGEKYPKAFSVKSTGGELWSGCAGGSFERWICAFLAQKGFDKKNWPEEVKKRVKVEDEVRFA